MRSSDDWGRISTSSLDDWGWLRGRAQWGDGEVGLAVDCGCIMSELLVRSGMEVVAEVGLEGNLVVVSWVVLGGESLICLAPVNLGYS